MRYEALATAVREVLTEAIAVGGSTLRDFVGADGADGYFMLDARVYDRAGEPCRVCATPIVRVVQGQRATLLLPHLPTAVRKGLSPELTQQPGVACPFG